MNKHILVASPDALFRGKLLHRFRQMGLSAIAPPAGRPADEYLGCGEIGLVVAEVDSPPSLPAGLKLIIAEEGISRRHAGEPCPHDGPLRVVPKDHLVPLAEEILREFCPELLPEPPAAMAADASPLDRRRSPRAQKSLRAYLHDPAGEEAATGRTVDIGSSGARLVTPLPLSPASPYALRLTLPSSGAVIGATARVVWTATPLPGSGFPSGVFFDRLAETDRFDLLNWLARETA